MSSRSLCVLNAGSSSLKFALYRVAPDGAPQRAMSGEAEGIGDDVTWLGVWTFEDGSAEWAPAG